MSTLQTRQLRLRARVDDCPRARSQKVVQPGLRTRPSDPCSYSGTLSALSRPAPTGKNYSLPRFRSSEHRIPDLSPQTLGNMPQPHHLPQGTAKQRSTLGKDVCTVRWAQTGCFQILFLCVVSRNMCPVQQPTR